MRDNHSHLHWTSHTHRQTHKLVSSFGTCTHTYTHTHRQGNNCYVTWLEIFQQCFQTDEWLTKRLCESLFGCMTHTASVVTTHARSGEPASHPQPPRCLLEQCPWLWSSGRPCGSCDTPSPSLAHTLSGPRWHSPHYAPTVTKRGGERASWGDELCLYITTALIQQKHRITSKLP